MAIYLCAAAVLFGLLLLVNNLIRLALRRERVSFVDTLLAFLLTLVGIAGLMVNALADAPQTIVETVTAVLALIIMAVGLATTIAEWFRPQRLRGSRGLLALFAGLLLLVSTATVPFLSVYFTLEPADAAVVAAAPTASAEAVDAESTDTPERSARAEALFKAIRDVLREEITADEAEVFAELDSGVPLARVVEAHGGNIDRVVERLTAILSESLRESAASGEIGRLQAALFISQMEAFVRLAVNTNLNELGGRFSAGPTPTGTRRSLMSLLTVTPTPTEARPTASPSPSRTFTPTATPSPTASATHERSTPRPSATRFQYATRTPAPTSTGLPPCLATVNYNLRLRAEPSRDSQTLATIPYTTAVTLTAVSPDGGWWQTSYDGQTGWVDGAYLALSAGCATLIGG